MLTRAEISTSVDIPGLHGKTALMIAIHDLECLRMVLAECMPNIAAIDEAGKAVFMHCLKNASSTCFEELFKGGCSASDFWKALTIESSDKKSALILAVESGKHIHAHILLEKLKASATTKDHDTYLHEQEEIIRSLKEGGDQALDKQGWQDNKLLLVETPPEDQSGFIDLNKKAEQFIQTLTVGTVAQTTIENLDRFFSETLSTEFGKKPLLVEEKRTTLLHIALEKNASQRVLAWLIKRIGKGLINSVNDSHKTPLDLAIASHNRGPIKLLLKQNVHVSRRHIQQIETIMQNKSEVERPHWQALHSTMQASIKSEEEEDVDYISKRQVEHEQKMAQQAKLLSSGAQIELGDVHRLLRTGYDINAPLNKAGMTLLMRVAQLGQIGLANQLLQESANPLLKDNLGKTAFGYASEKGDTQMANRMCVAMALDEFMKNKSSWQHIHKRHCREPNKPVRASRHYSNEKPFRLTLDDGFTVSQFPVAWDAAKVQKAITTIMESPSSVIEKHVRISYCGDILRGALLVGGDYEGVKIQAIVSNSTKGGYPWLVFTAYPYF